MKYRKILVAGIAAAMTVAMSGVTAFAADCAGNAFCGKLSGGGAKNLCNWASNVKPCKINVSCDSLTNMLKGTKFSFDCSEFDYFKHIWGDFDPSADTGDNDKDCTGSDCDKNTCEGPSCENTENTGNTGNTGNTENTGNTGNAGTDQGDTAVSGYAAEVLSLVNAERAKAGLSALTMNAKATSAANVRAVEISTSFSHTRPNGTSCFTALNEAGISNVAMGENIARGQSSAAQVMNDWMNSEGHRANIMNSSYKQIGIGVYKDSSGRLNWVQMFIS